MHKQQPKEIRTTAPIRDVRGEATKGVKPPQKPSSPKKSSK